jgi:hypothetical protein
MMDGQQVAGDLVRDLFGGRSSDLAALRVGVRRALLAPWFQLHAGTSYGYAVFRGNLEGPATAPTIPVGEYRPIAR